MRNDYSNNAGVKEPVTLRERTLKTGSKSLVLDYTVDGVRYRENLHLYIIPERNRIDKLQNEETMKTALLAKARKVVEIQNGNVGAHGKQGQKIRLTDYMDKRSDIYRKKGSVCYAQTVQNVKACCIAYRGEDIKLSQVTKQYLLGFIDSLNMNEALDTGTVYTYYNCLMIVLNSAVREELIPENPSKYLEPSVKPRPKDSTRAYLTLDEVKKLIETPSKDEVTKRAFLFSCFCGLRISDVRRLDWSMVHDTADGGLQVEAGTKKTGVVIYNPLSANAIRWMPERQRSGLIFPGLPLSPSLDRHIDAWAKSAGITKHVTFHVARHTHATLLLTYGADIYTVSKLLGHTNVQTTQIYAKIVDKKKVEAVNLIPDL